MADVVRDEPIILRKKIADVPEAGATLAETAGFVGEVADRLHLLLEPGGTWLRIALGPPPDLAQSWRLVPHAEVAVRTI
jgi:hypothetical protein